MRKLLNNRWFVATMAIAALTYVSSVVFSNGRKFNLSGFGTGDASVSEDATALDPSQETAWAMVNKIKIPDSKRDPFAITIKAAKVTAEKTPEPDLVDNVHLSAIWTQNGQTLVLVNDRIFQGGDEIGRLKIESASQDGVWFSHWKGRNFVSIGGNFTLNTPAAKFTRASSSL